MSVTIVARRITSYIADEQLIVDETRGKRVKRTWKMMGRRPYSCLLWGIISTCSLCIVLLFRLQKKAVFTGDPFEFSLRGTSSDHNRGQIFENLLKNIESDQSKEESTWAGYDVKDMRKHLGCEAMFEQERPIHSQEVWKSMRKLYTSIVGVEKSTVGSSETDYNGFGQPYYVEHNKYGRGIYAAVHIPKGALVWQNIRSAQFAEGPLYRKFLRKLEPNLACDVLEWSYVDKNQKINVDMDEGSYCNNGGKERNIDIDDERSEMFSSRPAMQLFATRDIEQDEELLCDYDSFSSANLRIFGL
jgi:hypothetical protein